MSLTTLPSLPYGVGIIAFLVVGGLGMELHAGHKAIHTTALSKKRNNVASLSHASGRMSHRLSGTVQATLGVSSQKFKNVSTPLSDQGSEYTGTIGVGTASDGGPQFTARVVFDTGSTNLWVASVLCREHPCGEETARRFYDPTKSSTSRGYFRTDDDDDVSNIDTADIDVKFGTGELLGPMHRDIFHVGPMKVTDQPFAMIRQMKGSVFASFPFEGILGLGFKSMSVGKVQTFLDREIEQKTLQHNEFAFFLSVRENQPSALLWGGIDKNLYHGDLRMFPVVQPHYWALELVDFKVGGESLAEVDGQRLTRVIVDSGTTYFTAPDAHHDKILSHMPSASCDKMTDYPNMTFVLRSTDGELFDLVVSQLTYMISDASDRCSPALMALNVNERYGPALLLGEVFMRHFFTVFDRADGNDNNAKIGIAPANFDARPEGTTLTSFEERQSLMEAEIGPGGKATVTRHLRFGEEEW